jgi:hypothetical protein
MPELPPDQREAGIVQVKVYCPIQRPVERVTVTTHTCDNRCLSCEVSPSQRLYSSGSGPEYWRHEEIFVLPAPVCRAMRSFLDRNRL